MKLTVIILLLSVINSTLVAATKPPPKKSSHVFDSSAMPNSHRIWIDAEALYWQPHMGSLSYGIESESKKIIKQGEVKHLDFDWDWGARVGLGYKIPHDKWDFYAAYTYLQGHAHGHAGGPVVFPSWASGFGFADCCLYSKKAKAHWHLNLNMADIELGRNCMTSRWLSLRPFMGARGLFIDHDFTVDYAGGIVASSDVDVFQADSDFWGAGLRFGVDSLWGLGKGLGIYGNGSASLLSGHFDVHEKEKLKKARSPHVKIEDEVENIVATADLALGLQWDYLFSNDRFHFGFKFGWEFNIFFDQNQLFNFLNTDTPGAIRSNKDDLTFQGVTLGLRFDF